MKKIFTALCFLIITALLNASPVDLRTAKNVAQNFWTANGGQSNVEWVNLTPQTQFTEFYILSNANGKGFIIVAGDNCVIPILGYSLSNEFDVKMPAHINSYLNNMEQEIAFYKENNTPSTEELDNLWHSLRNGSYAPMSTTAVSPLLTTTWDQSPYYNDLCPVSGNEKTVTGCVATATAQIMKFWNWPTRGTGSHSYVDDEFGYLSANFGNTTYQWSLMPNALNWNSSAAQVNAVATLMYHVGVAVEMDYGISDDGGSAAYSHDFGYSDLPCPRYALTSYFNYKNTIQSVYKENVSDAQWVSTMKSELNAGRPMLHSGSDDGSGHAFVCDGYDNNNLFHINWGWGGYCDGFYAANDLSPHAGGTGGNATYTFNQNRGIVIGIEPDNFLHANINNLYYPQEGGQQTFTVTFNNSNAPWSITSSQSWLTISPNSGSSSGSGMSNITATASVNNTGAVRTAIITVTQGTQSFTINVVQNECSNSSTCPISLVMNDTYGDGWNGASVTVSSVSGYTYGTYSITEYNGTETINVCPSDIVLTWNSGNYDTECSFLVQDAAGNTLLNISSIDEGTNTWNISNPCSDEPVDNCTITHFPWTEDFEGNLDCWSIADVDGDGNNWFHGNGLPHSGTHFVASYSYNEDQDLDLNSINYLISPTFTLPTTGNFRLTFYARSLSTNYPDSLLVKLSTNPNATSSGEFSSTLMQETGILSSEYQQYTIDLNYYRGQSFKLAFVHQTNGGYAVLVDDISIINTTESYTITVNPSDNSMGSTTGSGSYASGSTVVLTATANSNSRFTGWDDGNSENPREITVTGNATYIANFSDLGDDVLQYDNGEFYTRMGNNGSPLYWGVCFPASALGNHSQLNAIRIMDAEAGNYELRVYQGGTSTPGTLVGTQTFTLTGSEDWFEGVLANPITLSTSQNLWLVIFNNTSQHPAVAANYSGNPNGSWVSLDGSSWADMSSYNYHLTWMLRAVLSNGSTPQNSYAITVNSANNNMGYGSGSGTYQVGDSVTISATAYSGYRFTGWNDGETQNPRTIGVSGNATYTANFSDLGNDVLQYDNGEYTFSLGAGYNIYWAVCFPASELQGFSHLSAVRIMNHEAGTFQLSVYQGGTSAPGTLLATQNFNLTGSHNWVDCTLTNPITLNTSQNLWLVFYNTDIQYPATATDYAGNADGSWVSIDGSQWFSICDAGYYNTWMVRAVLSDGSVPQNDYTITVNSANSSMGSATGGGTYPEGTQITITATPGNHYHFTQWNDGNTQNPRVITVNGNATYTAHFAPEQYQITVNSSDPTMGTTSGSGMYNYGVSITITATPNQNYAFTNWSDGNTNNPRHIIVNGPASYTANFQSTIGIDDFNKEDFVIYSIGDQIHIKNAEGMAIKIYDMTGRLIVSDAENSEMDRVFTLNAKGIYLVKIGDNFVKKVIVNK